MSLIHGKQLRATSVSLAKLDNAGSQSILFGSGTSIGITSAPSAGTDLTNKDYVDSLAAGLDPKESVRVATRIDIGGTYVPAGGTESSGNFTGIDLTSDTLFDLDGVNTTVIIGDRILIKNQSDAKENGLYIVTTAGATGVIERSTDHDGTPSNEVSGGNYTFVETGDTEINKGYVLQGDGNLTLNTDSLVWVQFSQATALSAGNGIDITSNVVSVDLGTSSGLDISSGLIVDTSDGITVDGNGTAINLTTNGGLDFTGSAGSGTLNIVTDSTTANTVGVQTTANGAGVLYNPNAGLTNVFGSLEFNYDVNGGLIFNGLNGVKINGDATTANTIAIATTSNGAGIVYDNTKGLSETSDVLEVNLLGAGGLEFSSNAIAINPDITTGVTIAPISIGTNGVGVTVDNSTITHSGGTLSVDVAGLSLQASDISDFDEAARDAVGTIMTDSATIDFTYDDAANTGDGTITAVVISNSIDENHITTSVAGTGLSGGAGTALSVDYSTGGASGAAIEANSLAATTSGLGASMVGIFDTAGNFSATDVEAALAELFTAITNGGVPVTDNKEMTASVTSADFDIATATTIVGTPASGSYVQVFVNGVKMIVGDASKTKDCYFATDGTGAVAINIANIVATDELYWVGSSAGFELDGNDRIDFDYTV